MNDRYLNPLQEEESTFLLSGMEIQVNKNRIDPSHSIERDDLEVLS